MNIYLNINHSQLFYDRIWDGPISDENISAGGWRFQTLIRL